MTMPQAGGKTLDPILSKIELSRYHRQILIEGWGEEGQKRLKNSCVFVAGAGGLGSPCSFYLAAAGVGKIKICDRDSPDNSNLNRQILHNDSRIGINKALSAQITLKELNPHIEIQGIAADMNERSLGEMLEGADIIVDCLDNFPTRYDLNRAAIQKGIPMVHGAIHGFSGQVTFFRFPETPCFQCLFPEAPPKEVFPVVGATPGIIGCLQAMEAIKHLTGTGPNLKNRLLLMDANQMTFTEMKLAKDPRCPACSRA